MSIATKNLFKNCTTAQQAVYVDRLTLSPPEFIDDGFTTTALMSGCEGKVELRCGPAEYEVELFVHAGLKRLNLSDIIALPGILKWMQANRPNLEGKQRVEAEIEYVFKLLNEAIGRATEMSWLLRQSMPPPPPDSPSS